jgi:hypothetical protein
VKLAALNSTRIAYPRFLTGGGFLPRYGRLSQLSLKETVCYGCQADQIKKQSLSGRTKFISQVRTTAGLLDTCKKLSRPIRNTDVARQTAAYITSLTRAFLRSSTAWPRNVDMELERLGAVRMQISRTISGPCMTVASLALLDDSRSIIHCNESRIPGEDIGTVCTSEQVGILDSTATSL